MGVLGVFFALLLLGFGLLLLWGAGTLVYMIFSDGGSPLLLLPAVLLSVLGLYFSWASVSDMLDGDEDPDDTRVDRKRAVACVAEVLKAERQQYGGSTSRVYKLRLRVEPLRGEVYTTNSAAILNFFEQDDLKNRLASDQRKYHCLADREKPKRVEVLWDKPIG